MAERRRIEWNVKKVVVGMVAVEAAAAAAAAFGGDGRVFPLKCCTKETKWARQREWVSLKIPSKNETEQSEKIKQYLLSEI